MKLLPLEVQNIFISSCMHSFKRAVKELVYNSLDAKASSIAIRLNIQENIIQIVDNGYGILKCDMSHVGQKYMTSKIIHLSSLKSAPSNYGYKGQSLASIIEVSDNVKITSRSEHTTETYVKTFIGGKSKEVFLTAIRPSIGTTVDIKGFLYNLNIQKKNINPLTEIQEIKHFLEQVSLVHSNVSLSLRDELKNEIVLQIHKSRDINQTIHSLFDIKKEDYRELIVEKKAYKVTAYIGKLTNNANYQHWIFLNGRYTGSPCKLLEIFDQYLIKCLGLKKTTHKKTKNNYSDEDKILFKKSLPFYILFITCPYSDYDVNFTSKQYLEFKNWTPINDLLKKLADFYLGDIEEKAIHKEKMDEVINEKEVKDTRDEVKKIVDKVLACNSRNLGVSQMHNGVKGKLMKRNRTRKRDPRKPPRMEKENSCNASIPKTEISNKKAEQVIERKSNSKTTQSMQNNSKENVVHLQETTKTTENHMLPKKQTIANIRKVKSDAITNKPKIKPLKRKVKSNPLFDAFERESPALMKKCSMLANKVDTLLQKKIPPRKVFYSTKFQKMQYNRIRNNDRSVAIRNENYETKLDEEHFERNRMNDIIQKFNHEEPIYNIKSTYNLLQTILSTQNTYQNKTMNLKSEADRVLSSASVQNKEYSYSIFQRNMDKDDTFQRLTFESHHYKNSDQIDRNAKKYGFHFISTQSRDYFTANNRCKKTHTTRFKNNKPHPYVNCNKIKQRLFNIQQETSVTIEFSNTNEKMYTIDARDILRNFEKMGGMSQTICDSIMNNLSDAIKNNTYTLPTSNKGHPRTNEDIDKLSAMTIDKHNTYVINSKDYVSNSYIATANDPLKQGFEIELNSVDDSIANNNMDIVFITNTQHRSPSSENYSNFDPVNVCEALLNNNEDDEKSNMILPQSTNIPQSRITKIFEQKDKDIESIAHSQILEVVETSHHFAGKDKSHAAKKSVIDDPIEIVEEIRDCMNDINDYVDDFENTDYLAKDGAENKFTFTFNNRPGFIPKGMSPILHNCNTKSACNYNLEEDYFNDSMYKDFANDVETNTEVYKVNIQHVNELAGEKIDKFQAKIMKDHATLSFEGACLKEAHILNQVDNKFIAAKLKSKSSNSEHLVLFDQHAVHERIRLEKNLAAYINNDQWVSVKLDDIVIKLNKDQILYLHNYKEKFSQLGLKWKMNHDNELCIYEIPEAILGKNLRQVDVVMNAVKNLIIEEIDALKLQKGSITMYPKSIMDLVFSEACRYAIKFGDKLSLQECKNMLQDLSECKSPFQCAHGRPVMAVLMDIRPLGVSYKANQEKLKLFRAQFMSK